MFPVLMLIEMGYIFSRWLCPLPPQEWRPSSESPGPRFPPCLHRPRWRGVLPYFKVSGAFTADTSHLQAAWIFFPSFFASHSARISDSGEPFRSQTTNHYLSKFPLLLVVAIDLHIFTLESSPVLMIPFFWVLWAQKAFIYIDSSYSGFFCFRELDVQWLLGYYVVILMGCIHLSTYTLE